MDKFRIIIPARRNSKGLPFKNRLLFGVTLNKIPKKYYKNIIVTTDDEYIIETCKKYKIFYIERGEELSNDVASVRDVLLDVVKRVNTITTDTDLILLYLTYPERTLTQVYKAILFYKEKNAKSLLCKKNIKTTHPFLYLYDMGGDMGKQIVSHDLCRRQDYPPVFELSHYIGIFKTSELINLNKNMYNDNTVYFSIPDVIDVDTYDDLKKYNNENSSN